MYHKQKSASLGLVLLCNKKVVVNIEELSADVYRGVQKRAIFGLLGFIFQKSQFGM